jgi:glycosyltransferase involved in cell wall biosynthesis
VLLVTGIFPPDIGGPATHAADIRSELRTRGHTVGVVTLTDERRTTRGDGVVRLPRGWAWPLRHAATTALVATRGRRYDVVYATGLEPSAVAGAKLARRPLALKFVGDPAWERATRRGLTGETFDDFQHRPSASAAVRAMQWLRSWCARNAELVITPSEHLRRTVSGWSRRDDIVVIPNGVRATERGDASRGDRRGLSVLFAGRLVAWKRVELLIEAVARATGVRLDVVGEGPESDRLEGLAVDLGVSDRVRFLGPRAHEDVLSLMRAADVFAIASSYEGLPHVVIEAMASGTPVVATRDTGTPEVIVDGVNGVLVEPSAAAFATTFTELAHEPDRLAQLQAGASRSGRDWTIERCAERVERALSGLADGRPRAVFLGKNGIPLPLDDDHEEKFAVHSRHLDNVVVCSGPRLRLARTPTARIVTVPTGGPKVLSTPFFYTAAPLVALGLASGRGPSAIVCQSPYEAVGVLALRGLVPERRRPLVQVELHGDWRTASRLYGSVARKRLSPVADRLASWALRRADRVRVVSDWLRDVALDNGYRGPIEQHIAFSDYGAFYRGAPEPLPRRPHAVFVGVLERYKAVDVLVDSWPAVLERVPDARLTILGAGSDDAAIRAQIERVGVESSVTMMPPVARPAVRELLDTAWLLCLPSRSEGLGRIVLEAMAAGRAVVASRAGGPEELVEDGANGRLVEPDDPCDLARALSEVLADRSEAERMGADGRQRAERRDPAQEYESGIERLARWVAP